MAAAAGGGGGTGVAGATVPTGRSGSTAAAPTPLPTPIRSGNFLSVSADGVNLANRPQLQPQSRGGQLGVNGRADFLNGGGDAATTATTTTPAAAALNFKKDLKPPIESFKKESSPDPPKSDDESSLISDDQRKKLESLFEKSQQKSTSSSPFKNFDVESLVPTFARKSSKDVPIIKVQPVDEPEKKETSEEVPEIMRNIPEGAEAFAVLVGSVDFLDHPVMGFIRLSEGRRLGNLTEVPLPVRFIFILLLLRIELIPN